MLKTLKSITSVLDKITVVIAGIAFSLMIIITSMNVFARYFASMSFAWAEEITYLCFNWAVFFGICNVYKNLGLISIDALTSRLPRKIQRRLETVTYGIVAMVNIALTVWGTQLTIGGWARKTPNLALPYTFIDVCLPIATTIICLYSIQFLIMDVKGEDIKGVPVEEKV